MLLGRDGLRLRVSVVRRRDFDLGPFDDEADNADRLLEKLDRRLMGHVQVQNRVTNGQNLKRGAIVMFNDEREGYKREVGIVGNGKEMEEKGERKAGGGKLKSF